MSQASQLPRIGFATALFAEAEATERLIVEFESCVTEAPKLRWWSDSDDESWRPVTPELLAYPRRRLLSTRRRKFRGYTAYVHGGASPIEGHPTFAAISAPDPDFERLIGEVEMWSLDDMDHERLLEETVAASRRVQPTQGFAGHALAVIPDVEAHQAFREVEFAVSQLLHGVEILSLWVTEHARPGSLARTSWLTVVADTLLAPIGGRAALADLPSDVTVHDYGSGVVIQAGPAPSAGDVNKGETIPLYRAVAKKLAPIRLQNPLPLNIEEPRSLGRAETAKWFKRLERDP